MALPSCCLLAQAFVAYCVTRCHGQARRRELMRLDRMEEESRQRQLDEEFRVRA